MDDYRNLYFLTSTLFCQMPTNTQINLVKGSHKTRWNRYFEAEVQDCKDGGGLQLIFGQDVQKSKLPFWWNFKPLISIFFLVVDISLLLPLLTFLSSYCKTIKLNYSKLQAILIKYDIC